VAYIEAYRDQFGVEPICRALPQAGVRISPSAYYAARARPPPARAVRDAWLEKQILRVYKDSGERYGAWKVWDQLNREGIAVARCTVERLMRKLGLRGVRRGGWKKPRTTVPDPSQQRPGDLVNRDFAPDAPDRLWVVDFTFVATGAGTAYTAFVIDAFARLIAGWRTAVNHSTDLVLDALVMAVTYRARQGVKVAGLIHHSDAGSGIPVDPVRRRAGCGGDRAVGRVRRGLLRQRAGGEHRRAVQDRGHRPPGAVGNPRPGRGSHQRMGQLVQRCAGDAAHRGPPAGRIRAGLAGWDARPGPCPRAGQQAPPASRRRRPWPPLITLAGSARTRRGSAPDPGPPQRCPGPSRRVRQRAGISSPVA
jgi:putative transposase